VESLEFSTSVGPIRFDCWEVAEHTHTMVGGLCKLNAVDTLERHIMTLKANLETRRSHFRFIS
jgi:hypothetical protein